VDLYNLTRFSFSVGFLAYSAAAVCETYQIYLYLIFLFKIMGALLMTVFLALAAWMALFIFMKWNDRIVELNDQESGNC